MRTVYVVTHPEATHHVEDLVGGWYDSELTAAGVRAASAIAAELSARIPEPAAAELFSSDLRRTRRTAEIIGERLGVPAILDARLREKSYGVAEGRPQRWLRERFVPPPALGERLGHDEGIAAAETMADAGRRAYAAMTAILARDCREQIVVTHGGTATFVIAAWLALPLEALGYARFQVASGSITELREDDYFHNRQLVRLGETAHLPAE
ncbi:histidine phosphatase family protein [Nocardia sp. NPDC048505]|uniref:histidine phosphatase family protein n=1 Tax=unclassified Nocardia TaxID=2637762 RepID=UPI0033C5FB51